MAAVNCVEPDWERIEENGWTGVRAVCRCDHGPDHMDNSPPSGQCSCGRLVIGIVRGDSP